MNHAPLFCYKCFACVREYEFTRGKNEVMLFGWTAPNWNRRRRCWYRIVSMECYECS